MTRQIRAALEALHRDYPEWHIVFIGGSRAHWSAWRVFSSTAEMVTVQTLTPEAMRTRLHTNNATLTPRDDLGLFPHDYLRLEIPATTAGSTP